MPVSFLTTMKKFKWVSEYLDIKREHKRIFRMIYTINIFFYIKLFAI